MIQPIVSTKSIIETLRMIGVQPSKSLGQNFLMDQKIINTIITQCNGYQDILEIGSGLGALSIPLINQGKNITIVEFDIRLAKFLELLVDDNLSKGQVQIFNEDFLRFTLTDNFTSGMIVSSLPYKSASPILHRLITEYLNVWEKGVFIMQKEVIDKIDCVAPKATYWSQFIKYFYDLNNVIKKIPANAFYPQPKVDSSVIVLTRKSDRPQINPTEWSKFLHLMFKSPRKMVGKIIKDIDDTQIRLLKNKRPGELTIEELEAIYRLSSEIPLDKN